MKVSLKAARVNAGLTQKDVANALGVNEMTVVKWENGVIVPLADRFLALCRLYDAPVDDVLLPKKSCLTEQRAP